MTYKITKENYKVGGGCVYHGPGHLRTNDEQIARRKARWLQMKVNTTEGEEKRMFIERYRIKNEKYLDRANRLKMGSKAYFELKIQEILEKIRFKRNKYSAKTMRPHTRTKHHSVKKNPTNNELLMKNRQKFRRAAYGKY